MGVRFLPPQCREQGVGSREQQMWNVVFCFPAPKLSAPYLIRARGDRETGRQGEGQMSKNVRVFASLFIIRGDSRFEEV